MIPPSLSRIGLINPCGSWFYSSAGDLRAKVRAEFDAQRGPQETHIAKFLLTDVSAAFGRIALRFFLVAADRVPPERPHSFRPACDAG